MALGCEAVPRTVAASLMMMSTRSVEREEGSEGGGGRVYGV